MPKALLPVLLAPALAAQADWSQLLPATSPSARTEVQMVSDGAGALMFGGLNGPAATAYDELWRFDGSSWVLLTPPSAPPPRSRFAMGYYLTRGASGTVVVFGGSGQYTPVAAYGDTWEYDVAAGTWAQVVPATTSPAPRIHSRMDYDIINDRMLMFGGNFGTGAETWHWDGVDWVLLSPTNSPPAREQANLATNWGNGRIVLYGGSAGATAGILSDTWTWDGTDWTLQPTATLPGGGLRNGKLTYDFLRDRMVLYGGVRGTGGFSDSIWEYDGIDWTERLPAVRPLPRAGPGFCYVAGLGTSVLCAGYNGAFFNDTWTWQTNAPASVTTSGAGCPTSIGTPTLTVAPLPWAGDTVDIAIGNVPPSGLRFLVFGLSPTTTSLASVGFPSCAVIGQLAVAFTLGPVQLPIPGSAAYAGVQLTTQGAVLEPVGAALGLGLSDVATLTVGVR